MKWMLVLFAANWQLNCIPPNTALLQEQENNHNHYQLYLWGLYNQLEGTKEIAQHCFEEIIQTGGSIYTYPGYLSYLFEQKEYHKILSLMPTLEKELSDHRNSQLIFVKTFELLNMSKEADKKIMELSSRFKENAEIMYYAGISLLRNKQFSTCLNTCDEYLNNKIHHSNDFIFYYLKAQAHVNLANHAQARENVKKCLELNPSFEQGWLLSGLIAEVEGKVELALKGYRTFLQLVGQDPAVEQQILYLLVKASAAKNKANDDLQQALLHYRNKEYKRALLLIDEYLDKKPDEQQAHLLKLELLCCLHRTKEAVDHLKVLTSKDPQEEKWYRSLHLMYQAKLEQSKLIQLLQEIIKENKTSITPMLYLADIYIKKKDLLHAAELLHNAYDLAQDTLLRSKIGYQLGIIYYDTNQTNKLSKLIQDADTLETTFAPLQNLLAYYYAHKSRDLEKAQAYINKVLRQEPENIHYLDTQAYILYQQKEYTKAHEILSTLVKDGARDYFILKHTSKVLKNLGKKEEALTYVDKALQVATLDLQKTKLLHLKKTW